MKSFLSSTSALPRFVASVLLLGFTIADSKAIPYASGITVSGTTVSYILNEAAENVRVVLTGPASTNDYPTLAKGTHSFDTGGAASYRIEVSKATAVGWTRISDDANQFNAFFSPGGVAINRNPTNLAYFGRVYVSDQRGGTTSTVGLYTPFRATQEGIYVLNPDLSDALGQGNAAKTAGLTFTAGTAGEGLRSPWKIEVGEDNYLYIADFSTNTGTLFRADPDVNTGETVLSGVGSTANTSVHTSCNGSAIAKGSLAAGNLQIWAIDGQWAGSGGRNRLLRWDVASGPLPHDAAPAAILGSAGLSGNSDIQSDLDIAPDGKFFLCQNRAIGTPNVYNASQVNLRVYDTDGVTLLWDSLAQSIAAGLGTDFLVQARAVKISPDGKTLAVTINSTKTWVVGLTNGVPDISQRTLLNTDTGFTATTSTAIQREVAFDAAGNLYVANNTHEVLRVWSPGGNKVAITGSGGTFTIVSPLPLVSVTATDAAAFEQGQDPAVFTVARTGATTAALDVNYTMSGTAANGSDYTLSGTVTIPANAASAAVTLTPNNDVVAEFTETAILTLKTNSSYILDNPLTATASITDNETPELSIIALQPTVAESGSVLAFQVTRRGDTNIDLSTVNLTYAGSASGAGVDYTAPPSIAMAPGVVNQTVSITITDDAVTETNEPIVCNLAGGVGYTTGTPNSANILILDEDPVFPPGVFYTADFEADVAPLWRVNKANNTNGNLAYFSFDYSTVGIPAAPHSVGGTTRGLKLQANLSGGIFGGLSVSPIGKSFSGDYILSFDMWINFHGPLQEGGSGSSQVTGGGIGTAGTTAQWPGGLQDSVHFGATSDGGSSVDYRAYSSVAQTGYLPSSGVFAAGTSGPAPAPDSRDNADPYYSVFGGATAPAAQLALYPQQTGATTNGAIGMRWRSVVIAVTNGFASYSIDGLVIATVDLSTVTLSGGNILLSQYDINLTSTTDINAPALHFGLFDNVQVAIPSVPAITITAIHIIGSEVVIDFTAGAGDSAGAFHLQSSAVVNGTGNYADEVAGITQQSPGVFHATIDLPMDAARFYRLRR
jgi:hypothetical protein